MMQANPSTRSLQAIIHNLPKRFEACGFKNFVADEDQLKIYADICLKFSKNPKRKSLVMFGNVGSGKTHLAVAILRNLPPVKQNAALYPSRPTESIFLVADEFFAEMNQAATTQKMDKNDVISKYFKNFDVILLDELRVKNFTEAKRENLYLFVNRAYLNEKSIIITTNFTPEQLEKVDEPTVSRLNEMADGFLLFTGKDFRLRTKQ